MDIFLKRLTYEEARGHLAYCDSYSRLPTLLDINCSLADDDFLRLLGEEWSGFDNTGHNIDHLWDTAFGWWAQNGPLTEMMTSEELDAYNALPDVVTVYRGCYRTNKWGLSWSLSKEVANEFPSYRRYCRPGEQPLLVTAKALKKNIIAVKLDRDESEIITWRPKHVSTRHIKLLEESRSPAMPPAFAQAMVGLGATAHLR